jgi:hypothetical protein
MLTYLVAFRAGSELLRPSTHELIFVQGCSKPKATACEAKEGEMLHSLRRLLRLRLADYECGCPS